VTAKQGDLFNEAEQEASDEIELDAGTETKEIASNTPKKPIRKPLPKDLPRDKIVVDIPDSQKVCPCCQGALHKIGEDTREQLEFIPAYIKVIETVRPKYACRSCEKNHIKTPIIIAPPPPSPIPKGIATPSLLAQIIAHKYQYGLPLYRQESFFGDYGINLSRKTMSDWTVCCAELVQPVLARLKTHQLMQNVIHADETPVKVIKSDKKQCYMWVYCSGADSPDYEKATKNKSPNKKVVIYDFKASRSAECPKNYLGDYQGYLQVDGYAAYSSTQAVLVGCMAHVRRKFVEAKKAQVKGKTGKADWAVNHIQKLYRIEAKIKSQTPEEKRQVRQKEAVPLLNQFKEWLDRSLLTVTPKTALGIALNYCAKQWEKLIRYTSDGHLSIDNNRAERAIKPFVIGRKNWLFSHTERGAKASAALYGLIETAKANGLEPLKYLRVLFEELPKRTSDSCVEDLMPWNINV